MQKPDWSELSWTTASKACVLSNRSDYTTDGASIGAGLAAVAFALLHLADTVAESTREARSAQAEVA